MAIEHGRPVPGLAATAVFVGKHPGKQGGRLFQGIRSLAKHLRESHHGVEWRLDERHSDSLNILEGFYQNDLGSQVSQEFRAESAGEPYRHVEDSDPFQWSLRHF